MFADMYVLVLYFNFYFFYILWTSELSLIKFLLLLPGGTKAEPVLQLGGTKAEPVLQPGGTKAEQVLQPGGTKAEQVLQPGGQPNDKAWLCICSLLRVRSLRSG